MRDSGNHSGDSASHHHSYRPPPNTRAPKTILLAENDESNRVLVEQILSLAGYTCIATANGREALEALDGQRVDLALIDLSMPVLDGFRTAELIRRRPDGASLPLVAVTAHVGGDQREQALGRGFDAYLTKPFTPRALLALVARLLDGPHG